VRRRCELCQRRHLADDDTCPLVRRRLNLDAELGARPIGCRMCGQLHARGQAECLVRDAARRSCRSARKVEVSLIILYSTVSASLGHSAK